MSINNRMAISSGFPNFKLPASGPLGYLAYGGKMIGDILKSIGRCEIRVHPGHREYVKLAQV